jgi:hypothetical protein
MHRPGFFSSAKSGTAFLHFFNFTTETTQTDKKIVVIAYKILFQAILKKRYQITVAILDPFFRLLFV